MEDGITTILKGEIKSILEGMTETIEGKDVAIFEKVTSGRIKKVGIYSRPVAEILSDDEDEFLYTFQKQHKSRAIILMVSLFVKGTAEAAEKKKDNAKDLVITELEGNPCFNEKAITSQILKVMNGVRTEGFGDKATLHTGVRILVKCKVSNPAAA